ncbi:MOSC and FAD-binding oxidoreductase domain-containing protein [Phycicoccus sp. Root101]|uniref:MOSC and FAD-binding oxidoreductase domain-containing protein n=1 Tax=Phycicoccus sp. Root101 TaxID=1736421 RepID=UPI00190FC553|nr:MOSC and FAD-binding oxidoreductase domain-containing protein [Phycicoccus sp. Root101]
MRSLNIEGDGQGDLAGHGGAQRAILVYQSDSYRYWENHFGVDHLSPGAFGENFTVDGLPDDKVCIGDRFAIGTAQFEVTQPRVTCFRVGMRLGQPQLPALLVAHHRPGFYLRVLQEGFVEAGDEVTLLERGRHQLSVATTDALLYLPNPDLGLVNLAIDNPALSPGWLGSFTDMLKAGPGARSPAGVPAGTGSAWPGFRKLVVLDVVPETRLVKSFYLGAADGRPLPRVRPGQYLTLRVTGAGQPAPVRNYSLSAVVPNTTDTDASRASGATYRISVKRESAGRVSSYLHDHLLCGSEIEVAAPRGEFVLDDSTDPVLLISAGIGVTPVLAILHDLAQARTERQVWWIHATQSLDTLAFAEEVEQLLALLPSTRSAIYLSEGLPPLPPGIRAGRLTPEIIAAMGLPTPASVYLCGPPPFMNQTADALLSAGIGASKVHTERFGSVSAINPGVVTAPGRQAHQPRGVTGTGPAVTFARTGLTTHWSDEFASVLELAEGCDVPTRWSCRSGVCHTCVTSIMSGTIDYITAPLEPPGHDETLICISRPLDDIVLDL